MSEPQHSPLSQSVFTFNLILRLFSFSLLQPTTFVSMVNAHTIAPLNMPCVANLTRLRAHWLPFCLIWPSPSARPGGTPGVAHTISARKLSKGSSFTFSFTLSQVTIYHPACSLNAQTAFISKNHCLAQLPQDNRLSEKTILVRWSTAFLNTS